MSFAVLLLSGCGLYTKYERPDVNTEGLVRDPLNPNDTLSLGKVVDGQWTAVNGQDENFGNMPWRSVFTDPKLQELIQQGLDKNANLLNAALNVKMVEEQLKVLNSLSYQALPSLRKEQSPRGMVGRPPRPIRFL